MGSRHGVAQGVAMGQLGNNLAGGITDILSNQQTQGLNASNQYLSNIQQAAPAGQAAGPSSLPGQSCSLGNDGGFGPRATPWAKQYQARAVPIQEQLYKNNDIIGMLNTPGGSGLAEYGLRRSGYRRWMIRWSDSLRWLRLSGVQVLSRVSSRLSGRLLVMVI